MNEFMRRVQINHMCYNLLIRLSRVHKNKRLQKNPVGSINRVFLFYGVYDG